MHLLETLVLSCSLMIINVFQCFEGTEMKHKQGVRVRETLKDLKKWLVTDKDRDTKNNQKLLRNLRVQ